MATATTTPPASTRDLTDSRGGDQPPARRRTGRGGANLRGYLGVALIVIWGLLPFYWMVVTAFRDVGYTFDTTPWPTHVTLDNFRTAFSTNLGNHFGRALINSVFIGICTTAIALIVGIFAAYALARLQFKGKFVVLGIILGASMFPGVALLTPLFQLFTNIHWLGQYQALIIPDISFVLPLTVYTLTAFFAEMPWELEESARMDGCTPGQAFRKVILPLAAPGLFTSAILAFIASWNEFLLASELSNQNPNVQPVTVAIANFQGSQPHQDPYTAVMAAGTIVTIPLILMVLAFQRRIVSGLTAGGVKG
ncbi:MAG: carbohydrate ABC transporter permease [Nocardioidaceae bacterium]